MLFYKINPLKNNHKNGGFMRCSLNIACAIIPSQV
jgi:hypothetical protein